MTSLWLALLALQGSEHWVAADGKADGAGTRESPWDLATAISGARKVEPGATLWVKGGTYKGSFEAKLAGREGAPIVVRAVPGERATILDSGLRVVAPATHLWIRDLEIAGSVPVEKRVTSEKGSWPKDLPGADGVNIHAGADIRLLNCVIRDNVGSGVGWWAEAVGGEIHGCIILGNGWKGPDRGHGHSIYTQNREEAKKTISACILSAGFDGSYTMHAYGSGKAYVDHFVIEDNIAFGRGPFLVGGGRPSRDIVVRRNVLHGIGMQVGYTAPENEDCEVRDNVIAGGGLSINRYKKAVDEGNLRNFKGDRAVLIPNKVDPDRAHVAVLGAPGTLQVEGFLKPGQAWRLFDARDFYGKPVLEGKAEGGTIALPPSAPFAAFVLRRVP
jgi:hypothetical protein